MCYWASFLLRRIVDKLSVKICIAFARLRLQLIVYPPTGQHPPSSKCCQAACHHRYRCGRTAGLSQGQRSLPSVLQLLQCLLCKCEFPENQVNSLKSNHSNWAVIWISYGVEECIDHLLTWSGLPSLT